MKIFLATFLAIALAGCAGLGQSNMSAEQLKELAKDKSIGVMTNEVSGIWGTLKNKVITVDQRVLIDGAVTVAPDGSVTISNKPALPRPLPAFPTGSTFQPPASASAPVTQIEVPVKTVVTPQ